MRKLKLFLVLALAFTLFATPVFAQARYGVQVSNPVETSTSLVLPAGTWLYGVKLYADASSSWMAIYDSASIALGLEDQDDRIEEIGEATQYDSVEVWYPTPIYCTNGVSVIMTTGVGYIYYGPPPR